MPADDGTTTSAERARLETIAYGAESTPEEAAAARLALAHLGGTGAGREARRASAPSVPDPDTGTPGTDVVDATTGLQSDAGPGPSAHDAATPPSRPGRRWLARLRDRRIAVGAALVVTAVAAFGVGIGVGSLRSPDGQAAAASASAAASGSITLGEFLAAPQTFADQLPGSIIAPVRLHSTRLVFSNRSLSGDDSQTPWDVYAAVGNDDGVVCLIATADGRTSSQSCFPRREALTGTVVLVAQSASGVLAVRVSAGVVTGRVTPTP
jgi:hypothetical protein